MKVREDLVFDKNSCHIIRFIDLGKIGNVLSKFERQCKSETEAVEESVA